MKHLNCVVNEPCDFCRHKTKKRNKQLYRACKLIKLSFEIEDIKKTDYENWYNFFKEKARAINLKNDTNTGLSFDNYLELSQFKKTAKINKSIKFKDLVIKLRPHLSKVI